MGTPAITLVFDAVPVAEYDSGRRADVLGLLEGTPFTELVGWQSAEFDRRTQ